MQTASPYRLTFFLCLAEILALAAIATFPALLPNFKKLWSLSNTEAGWINAAYFGAYMLSVPFLTGITDRFDARKVMAFGALVGAVAGLLFSFFAGGFWSALVLRFIAGISLAGVYMPGLKVVSDHTEGRLQSRFVSFYTASFSIGTSVSYLMAGEIYRIWGWRWAFGLSGAAAAAAAVWIWALAPPGSIRAGRGTSSIIADFGVVLRNRKARAYILGYTAHTWELFSMRSWIVAFLAFSLSLQPKEATLWTPTRVAFCISLIGLPASICGNELARVFGRRRLVAAVMIASAGVGCILGLSPGVSYAWVAALAVVYGVTIVGDSAALTAGAVEAAPDGFRGATLAVHSTLGFAAAFIGPLAVGLVLDLFGGGAVGWAMAFGCMAAGGLTGVAALAKARK
jgi:MFS family permease